MRTGTDHVAALSTLYYYNATVTILAGANSWYVYHIYNGRDVSENKLSTKTHLDRPPGVYY